MEAKSRSFTFIRDVKNFVIPFFQRSYEWDEEQWQELINTLISEESSPFLGSVILKQNKVATGDIQSVLLIDGQQRLTTLSILLKVLLDLYPDSQNINIKSRCEDILFYQRQASDTEKFLKITHSYLDKEFYETIIAKDNFNKGFLNSIKKESHQILRCYQYFHKELMSENHTEEQRTKLLNLLLDTTKPILIVIDIDADDDEQMIFRTINSEGSPLGHGDIIKNDLFNKAKHLIKNEKNLIHLYEQTWQKTFASDQQCLRFWREKRVTGRMMRDNLSIFLHIYAVIKHFYPTLKSSFERLNRYYRQARIDLFTSEEEITTFIKEICTYAEIYREYITITTNKEQYYTYNNNNYHDVLGRLAHILKVLEISTLDPFLIYVMHDVDTNQKIHYLLHLEGFVMRRMLAKESTITYNRVVFDFIKDVTILINANNIADQKIDKHRIFKPKEAKLVLFWIELYLRSQSNKYSVQSLPYRYSLEHILPQKWQPMLWPLSPHHSKEKRNEQISFLGNLTLLTLPLNASISNNQYKMKMEGNGQDHGLLYYAKELLINDTLISAYEKGEEQWDEEKIAVRTQEFYEIILKMWQIPTKLF